MLGTEKVKLIFDEDGIDRIAELATEINQNVENIGARRLHTIMEKLLEDIVKSLVDKPDEVKININESENTIVYELNVGDGNGEEYKMYFKTENIKVLKGSYDVAISSKGIGHFSNQDIDLEYWIALEPDSEY